MKSKNDEVTETSEYDEAGRLKRMKSEGGTDEGGKSDVSIEYYPDNGPDHSRGLPKAITRPVQGLAPVRIERPNGQRIIQTDERNVRTDSQLDSWLRPKKINTSGPDLVLDEEYQYDAGGRMRVQERLQNQIRVRSEYTYDALGRVKSASTNNVAVNGSPSTLTESTSYNLPSRTVTRTLPSGAVVTETLDGLGRVQSRVTTTGGVPIREELAYDIAGNLVYSSDNHSARASAYDVHGRAIATLNPDKTMTRVAYDDWGRPKQTQTFTENATTIIAESKTSFTPAGRLKQASSKVDDTTTRTTDVKWDGAGRTTTVATSGRTTKSAFDDAGRLKSTVSPMQETIVEDYNGTLVSAAKVREKGGAQVPTSFTYNTAGNATEQKVGSLTWNQTFDQSGNLTSSAQPARPGTAFSYDARGALVTETKPGGAAINHAYDAAGGAKLYQDEVGESTGSTTDLLGRPLSRTYADGTTEEYSYDGTRLASMKDRQGRTFKYEYNAKGQTVNVLDKDNNVLDHFEYDEAGRLSKWATRDALLEYQNYDLEGRPRRTVQTRFKEGRTDVLDTYSQEHRYNVHGEREAAGDLTFQRDEAGNITSIKRNGSVLMTATYRNAGRPVKRTVTTSDGATIERDYTYKSDTGQIESLTVKSRGLVVAGSSVTYDGVQIARAQLLGLSAGARANEYTYDNRSRLQTGSFAREGNAPPAVETVTPADVRVALDRSSGGSLGFSESAGHKIVGYTKDGVTRTFEYAGGAERIDDGKFTYQFDARGRLVMSTEKTQPGRRVRYFYAGSDRVVGRRAEYSSNGAWKLEDRANIMAADGLPAETTFVWDPISDQLIAVYATGGALLRQITHGGASYDDPIEVAVTEGGILRRYYPVFDEAAAGNLQVILASTGEIVQRAHLEGPYGEDQFAIRGPAVDKITITAKKDASGNIESVDVRIRTTEQILNTSVAAGTRLAALDETGAVIATAPTPATLQDEFTAEWHLSAAQWNKLIANATALSIAATSGLRAAAWSSDTRVIPPTTPVTSLFSSPDLPVEYRQSSSSLASQLTSIGTNEQKTVTVYELGSLTAVAASTGSTTSPAGVDRQILTSAFQALPFVEPANSLVYVRNRWLDTTTGTFVSPDPVGYRESSNVYAYCHGDPVNCKDPSGELGDPLSGDEIEQIRARVKSEAEAYNLRRRTECSKDNLKPICQGTLAEFRIHEFGDNFFAVMPINSKLFKGRSTVVFVNGVWNDASDAFGNGLMLSAFTKRPVDVLFNPTQRKKGMPDIFQTGLINKQDVVDLTTRNIILYLRDRLRQIRANEYLAVYVHSQGAAIISSVAKRLSVAERARIDLTTYGGAAWSLPGGFHSVRNVVNVIDPIPLFFGKTLAFLDPNNDYILFFHSGWHPLGGYLVEEEYSASHEAWLGSPEGRRRRAAEDSRREADRRAWVQRNWDKR